MDDALSGVPASQQASPGNGRQRIGDADREATCNDLVQHFVHGRLSQAELDDRLTLATRAQVRADLMNLLSDLPPLTTAEPEPSADRPTPSIGMPLAVAITSCLGVLGLLTYSALEAASQETYLPTTMIFPRVFMAVLFGLTGGAASTIVARRSISRWRWKIENDGSRRRLQPNEQPAAG